MAGSLIDPIARARTFAARRGGMIDNAKLRKRMTRLERALSPLRNDQDTADDFTSFMDEVDESPEASDETVGRVYLVRNEDADDVLNVGITAEDGTPILVGLSTISTGDELSLAWTEKVTGLTLFNGVAIDASGNIYTISSASTLKKYNSLLVVQWTATLTGLNGLWSVAADTTSILLPVADGSGIFKVSKRLSSTGAAGSPATFGTTGSGDGEFQGPRGVCFDGTNVWITDSFINRIQKFTASTGAYVSQFDGSSSGLAFAGSYAICLGPTSTHLYVLDAPNGRVVKFLKSDHSFVAEFVLGVGNADGQISDTAEGIAVDSQGRIWIADTGNHRIQVFDSAGAFLGKVGSFGGGSSQFKYPKQIAVGASDVIWIADSGNNRLVTLAEDTGGVTPVITTRSNTSGTVASGASVTVDVTCNAGEVVVGGGHQHVSGNQNINNHESYPLSGTTWRCSSFNGTAGNVATMLTCYARCMTTPIS